MAVEKVCGEGMSILCSTMGGVECGPSRVFGIHKELDGVREVDRRRVKGLARLQAEPRVGVVRLERVVYVQVLTIATVGFSHLNFLNCNLRNNYNRIALE